MPPQINYSQQEFCHLPNQFQYQAFIPQPFYFPANIPAQQPIVYFN